MKFTGRNVFIDPSATLGSDVQIGDNTTIYPNVVIGDRTVIANDCIIGEPETGYYQEETQYSQPETIIGSDSLIRSHAIIYASVMIGSHFSCGHRVTIREAASFGNQCRVGTLSDIQGNCTIGNHVWLHSNVHIGQNSRIGDFVFIYPYVVLTNDPYPPSSELLGVDIRAFAQISTGSRLMPGVTVHEHALVGANSLVTKDVQSFSCVVGNPARHVKDVRDIKLKNGASAYPWPLRFERGMPWEGIGFARWKSNNQKQ
ncbi:hypothetical protein N9D95_02530 [Flavobacteriales bacterium]|nr:hypothetical protein [Flavobacteriales bacterium]